MRAAARFDAWPLLVLAAVVVLLPVGRTAELPWLIGALAGLLLALRQPSLLGLPAARLATALFACYWLPELLSAPLAVAPAKSWSTVAAGLRFLPFAWFAVWALGGADRARRLRNAIALVVALWLIDAGVQMLTGYGLAGAAEEERISGIFGAGNLKFGPVLAVLSPFMLFAARDRFGRPGLVFALLALLVPVLLAGSRAAWVAYLLVCLVIGWGETRNLRRFAGALLALALAVGVVAGLALRDSPRFEARIERSLLAFAGGPQQLDAALAGRLRIWRVAFLMTRDHPCTGVGVRGFRHAYPRYALPGDDFIDASAGTGAAHAHQILLEVLSETGLIGLLGWLLGGALALRGWQRAGPSARRAARAPALALLAMTFPLNTHLAFYSAWWGLFFWWLVALYCGALGLRDEAPPTVAQ